MTHPSPSPMPAPRPTPPPPKDAGALRALLVVVVALALVGGAMIATLSFSSRPASPLASADAAPKGDPAAGQQITMKYGCVTCHSSDGSMNRGPTYQGLWGSRVTYDDGSTGIVDDTAVREALHNPTGKIIENYEGIMPKTPNITEPEILDLLAYLRSIGHGK